MALTLLGLKITLVGLAQIMLQNSLIVGTVFAAGAIFNSPTLAIMGLIGSASGALTAAFAGFDQDANQNGLFGFNGALVGFGLGYFYDPQWQLVLFVFLGSVSSALIMQCMLKKGLLPYTFPFVVTTWSIMSLFAVTGWFEFGSRTIPPTEGIQFAHSISRGFGQVLFQENFLTGFLLISAVMFKSWLEGLFAISASVFGALIAFLLGFPVDAINLGIFGYNGVLCAIALSGMTGAHMLSAFVTVTLSVFITWITIVVGIPPLTAPFVFSTWTVLWLRKRLDG